MNKVVKPSQHPNLDYIENLWQEGKRATEIVQLLSTKNMPAVNVKSLAKYGQRNWSNKHTVVTQDEDLTNLKDQISAIEEQGMKVGKVAVSTRSTYVWEKQEDGSNQQVKRDTTARSIEILPDDSPHLELATLPDIQVNFQREKSSRSPEIGLAISLPDMQIGYYRDNQQNLYTLQDERVLDVTHQILAELEATEGIDTIVMQGDNGDFAEFGKYSTPVGYTGTTQLTINRLATEGATLRAISPDSVIKYLAGNHEERLNKTLVDKVPSLVGITRAFENTPVNTIEHLCRFDEYNIDYLDGYPANEFWLNDGLRFIHGNSVKAAKGATAASMLPDGFSTVYGHIHRQELVWGVTRSRSGSQNIFAGSAGTACKITGEVPSFHGGVTNSGTPKTKKGLEDWQQGLMVIYYEKNGFNAWPEMVTIHEGETVFRGKKYVSQVDSEGTPYG